MTGRAARGRSKAENDTLADIVDNLGRVPPDAPDNTDDRGTAVPLNRGTAALRMYVGPSSVARPDDNR
ncbi:MAG: hypothetical protein RI885_2214 [Actinomycetota bacterium]